MSEVTRENVLVELTKQIAAVSGAVLAVLASLAAKFLSDLSGAALYLLAAAAVALLVSGLASLVSNGRTIWYVAVADGPNKSKAWNSSAFWANASFFSFALALVFLLASGLTQLFGEKTDVKSLVEKTTIFLREEGKIGDAETWQSLELITIGNEPRLNIKFAPSGKATLVCQVHADSGVLISCK